MGQRVLCLLLIVFLALAGCEPGSGEIALSKQAPEFKLLLASGEETSLSSFKGKTVLLNFWALWCPPCVNEMPALEKLYQELKNEGFVVVAINLDKPDKRQEVLSFIKEKGLSFPVPMDPDFTTPLQYKLGGFPESFFIDPEGKFLGFQDPVSGSKVIRIISERPWDSKEIVEVIRELIKKKQS